MKTKGFYVSLGIIMVFLTSGGLALGASPPEKLTIGLSSALSGPAAAWGLVHERTCTLVIEEINAEGGISVGGKKYMLDLKSYDNGFDPSRAVEIAKRMMSVDKVAWIVTMGAATTKPIIPFTEENKTIVFNSAAGTDLMVFQKQNFNYRFAYAAPEAFSLVWEWAVKKYPQWKTTVGMQPDDASGWDAMKDVKGVLPKVGVKLAGETFYKRGTTDFYPVLTKLLAAKPDCFDLQNMPPADQGRVVKQAREMGYKGPFLAPVAPTIAPILEIAGPAAEGLIFGAQVDPTSRFATREQRAFYDKWMKTYGPPFDFLSISIVYSVYLPAQAIEKANSLDPDKVTKILQTAEFNAHGRKIKMGGVSVYGPPPRSVGHPFGIHVVENGKTRMIDLVELPADY